MASTPETQIEIKKEERQRHLLARISFCLKKARLCRRLSVEQVSIATGLHKKLIERIEGGAHWFNIRTIEPLLWHYGLRFSQVFSYTMPMPKPKDYDELKIMQKHLNRYLKSKKRIEPQLGVQLKLGL